MLEKENKIKVISKMLVGVTTRWWKGHKEEIKTFQQASTLLCDRFEDKKEIKKFNPEQDPQEHIERCKEIWRKERVPEEEWTHGFAKILDVIP